MANHGCINGVLDTVNYSSPIPIIGLYIAAASLVCSIAMLYDMFSGLLHRKPWLPCRLFSLNSVTLTLLAIAAKLPVDLTTPMPSTKDQMSKLTGTSIICVSMAFLIPSLGTNQSSECFTNLAALSILVVTVVANVCIQIHTGVIVLFVAEHIIVLCCMLAMLMVFWVLSSVIESEKDFAHDHNKDLLRKGQGSMLEALKLAYLYGYNFNPQFRICKSSLRELVSLLCITCVVVVIEAAFRSRTLEFCGGTSDYDWSMPMIVVTQIITIVVGGLASGFRSLSLLDHEYDNLHSNEDGDARKVIERNPLLRMKLSDGMCGLVIGPMQLMVVFLTILLVVLLPLMWVFRFFGEICKPCCNHDGDIDEYKHLVEKGDVKLEEWSLGKSVRDMRRWIEASKRDSLDHLSRLLLKTRRSQQLDTMELKDQLHPHQEGLQVSALSMVLLIRIAEVSIPSKLSRSLVQAYSEVHEILHFINYRLHSASFKNIKISRLAEAVWIGNSFRSLLPKITKKSIQDGTSRPQSNLDRALEIITGLKTAVPSDFVWKEVGVIIDFIQRREYSSIEALYNYIEQLVVDMLHIFLAQLPHAIFKEVTEGPAEEFDERVKHALKFLCKMELIEAHIQWSFPIQCTVSSLITPQVPRGVKQIEPLEDNKVDVSILVDDSEEIAIVISDDVV